MDVVIEFIAKTTVRVRAYVYDDDGALVDPTTSIKVTIYDPDGTKQVDGIAMTKDVTGIYDYYYQTTTSTTIGWWRGEIVVVDGTDPNDKTSVGTFSFRIK